ncbi:MAG: class I SAM-dependent methyltransferase [Candidatus Riflebacteria bacterium]|nr:class I SAM-dependent methyltransferase [Candidatus Riflebacteria bacterium]
MKVLLYCPLCDDISPAEVCNYKKVLVRCNSCGIIFVPRMSGCNDNHDFYRQSATSPFNYYSRNLAASEKNSQYLFSIISRFAQPGKVLDIGCSTGIFMQCAEKHGFEAEGLEIDPNCVRMCNEKFGLKVHNKSVEESEFDKNRFDLINLGDVIEHFVKPLPAMRKIQTWLKPGGIVSISTPDIKSVAARWFQIKPDEHLTYFNSTTLSSILEKAGFKVIYKAPFDPWRDLFSLRYSTTMNLFPLLPGIINFLSQAIGSENFLFRLPFHENLIMIAQVPE